MIRRPPRSTLDRSSAASDVYKRQMIYIETPANPTNDLIDIQAKKEIAKHFSTKDKEVYLAVDNTCLLYTSPSPRDRTRSRMPSSA